MKFSIVIPAYNAETTIGNTLKSVLEQSFPDFEIVIVNDGSIDETNNIVMDFLSKNNHLKCRYLKTCNRGVSAARNTGWNCASGDFICFIDSDDIWHSDKLKIMNEIISCINCDLIGHRYCVSDFPDIVHHPYQVYKMNILQYLCKNHFQTSCVCLRRDIPMRFDESMSHSEDYALFLDMAQSYKIYKTNLVLTKLGRPQLTAGGLSQNRLKMRKGELKAYAKLCFKHKRYMFLLPFLATWSILKHIRAFLILRVLSIAELRKFRKQPCRISAHKTKQHTKN